MTKYYAGIGSRKTPDSVLDDMTEIARRLRDSYILRSGGADGADSAFEQGAGENKQIFIPWNGFNGLHANGKTVIIPEFDFEMASIYHPAWHRCSPGAKKLHARNRNQIYGPKIRKSTISEFVICWTPGGEITGGTGQAIRIAKSIKVPIFNMAKLDMVEILEQIKMLEE
jgi:hypothetical protein